MARALRTLLLASPAAFCSIAALAAEPTPAPPASASTSGAAPPPTSAPPAASAAPAAPPPTSAPPTVVVGAPAAPSVAAAAPRAETAQGAASAHPATAPEWNLEAGGLYAQGVDATGAATRQGGGFAGATWNVTPEVPLAFRWTIASGSAAERLSTPSLDGASPTSVASRTEVRQSFNLSAGYRLETEPAAERWYVLPHVGPRLTLLADDVAPLTAFELGGGLRAGVQSIGHWDLGAFLAYGYAVAKTSTTPRTAGVLQSETRFGATMSFHATRQLALLVGYEGDVAALQHANVTYQQMLFGTSLSFD